MADAGAVQEMLAEFNKLYETGEFQLGYCLADVQVNEQGAVDTVRVVRPQNVDKRVESAIVRSMKSRRYNPATAPDVEILTWAKEHEFVVTNHLDFSAILAASTGAIESRHLRAVLVGQPARCVDCGPTACLPGVRFSPTARSFRPKPK